MDNSFRNTNSNEHNNQLAPSQKGHVSEADPKQMNASHNQEELSKTKDTGIIKTILILGLLDLSLSVFANKQTFIVKIVEVLKWCRAHYGREVALGIASTALFYYVVKGKKFSRLEVALQMFEMKKMSEYTKKSFNWIYLCKKKQFTSSKNLGNVLTAIFYEEKLRQLEEARQIIEQEVNKLEKLKEEQQIQTQK